MGNNQVVGGVMGLHHSALVGGKTAFQEVAPAVVVLRIGRGTNAIYTMNMLRALVKFNPENNIE